MSVARPGYSREVTPRITCRYCPREIPVENLDRQSGIGRCDHCQTVMDVRSQLGPARARPDASRRLPPGIRVEGGPEEMRLEVHHGARDRFPFADLLAMALVVGSVWYATGGRLSRATSWLRTEAFLEVALESPELVIELASVLVGPLLAGLVFLLRRPSRTYLSATRDGFVVRRSLLPFLGTSHFDVMDVDQLYSRERAFQMTGIDPEDGELSDVTGHTYELRVRLKDRSDRLVIDGLWRADQALFLEQRLEEFLGLPDRPVPMEIERCPDQL